MGNEVSESADQYEYCAGIAKVTLVGHPNAKEVDGFKIRMISTGYVEYRENFTYGY